MGRVRHAFGARRRRARGWAVLGAVTIALALAVPALGTFGSSPSKECAHPSWNGQYWKAEIDDRKYEVGDIETSSGVEAGDISLEIDKRGKAIWSLSADAGSAVFRIYEKGGRYNDVQHGFWLPGDSGKFYVSRSISHVTFCFKDVPQPEISIEKKTNGADPVDGNPVSNFINVGEEVKWTYVVKNTGNVSLKDVVVTDDREGVIAMPDGVLKPGMVWVFDKKADAGAEESTYPVGYTNLGTVTAVSAIDGTSTEDSDSSGYYGSAAGIQLEVFGPEGPVLVDTSFDWRFRVTNTGNVPLEMVVVTEDGVTVGNCDLGVVTPGDSEECTLTETATLGQESSTFVASGVFDDGETETVVDEIVAGVTYEINQPPTAVDDEYAMDERDETNQLTLVVPAGDLLGLLDNDTDPDEDPLTVIDNTEPANGELVLEEDGSFEYTPSELYEWGDDEFSRVDTFEYTVSDGLGGTDIGLVSITVDRVICIGESVSAEDGAVEGNFTLLSTANSPCKNYAVGADQDNVVGELISLEVPGDGNESLFRGELTFSPQMLSEDGELILGIQYDPDLTDGIELRTLPVCINPVFDSSGLIIGADLPIGEGADADTWCFGGALSVAVGANGEMTTTSQVIGFEDPGFSAR